MEEVGLTVKPVRKVGTILTDDREGEIHWWLVDVVAGKAELKNDEHSELGWFALHELKSLKPIFADDIEMFKKALTDH